MFYKMIENKCREWYASDQCTVKSLIDYIEKTGQMRDAQIEALKTYLFLKIHCGCKPLEVLFNNGYFNTIDLNAVELSTSVRDYLLHNTAAAALFEYSIQKMIEVNKYQKNLKNKLRRIQLALIMPLFFIMLFTVFHTRIICLVYQWAPEKHI